MREQYEKIKEGSEIRSNLITLKEELKDRENGAEALCWLRSVFEKEPEVLLALLDSEDAKVRKNTALILGNIGTDICREALFSAYAGESRRFVKSAYLTALKGCDCTVYTQQMKERRRELLSMHAEPEEEKHVREELEALNELLSEYESARKRRFTGLKEKADVVLTTFREYRELTARQITKGETVLFGSGVRVKGGSLEELLSVRTFRELLFCLNTDTLDPENCAQQLASSDLRGLLRKYYDGEPPWRFRIECRDGGTQEQKAAFTKRLADALMRETAGELLNDVSDYEAEIRLIRKKSGDFLPLLKLSGLPDHRFSYRKNSVAASMQPFLAAMLMELAGPYLKEQARVLDPFCGTGTLLLERNYRVHADTLYGVDIYGPAVKGARENAQTAGVPAHFINKDIRSFSHEYLFDEIVTDMPSRSGKRTAHDTEVLHRVLFDEAVRLLKPDSMIFLYTHDRGFAKKAIRENGEIKLEKEWQISVKEDTWFLAARYGGKA